MKFGVNLDAEGTQQDILGIRGTLNEAFHFSTGTGADWYLMQ